MDENANLSRKERRELRRQEQREHGQSVRRGNALRRFLIWGGVVVVIVLIGWFAWKAGQQVGTTGGSLSTPVSAADQVRGPDDAPVTLVEYADFQCPGCAAFHPIIAEVMAEEALAGKVRFVYRHFPLTNIHANAVPAARAAEAAALQGKFWEMHDAIFEGQATWSNRTPSAAQDIFAGYAESIGLDVAQWEEDLDSDVVKDKVDVDLRSGTESGVNSTPSFFVNGSYVNVFAASDVVGAFRQALIDASNANP